MWGKGKKSKKQKQDPTTSTLKKMTKQISALTAAIASSMGIKTDGQGMIVTQVLELKTVVLGTGTTLH